jgi:hypothetical protein
LDLLALVFGSLLLSTSQVGNLTAAADGGRRQQKACLKAGKSSIGGIGGGSPFARAGGVVHDPTGFFRYFQKGVTYYP